jgi:glycosyltransferase involved in cell wall biosynthesis
MNILVICSRNPYPVESGGSRRIDSIIRNHVQNGHRVTLVYIGNLADQKYVPDGVNVKNINVSKAAFISNILLNLWRLEPFQVSMYRFKELQNMVSDCTYDVLICHMIRVSWVRVNKPYIRKILEMSDSLSLNYSRMLKKEKSLIVKNPLKYLIYKIEMALLVGYEREMVDKFDKTVLVSAIDKNHILAGGDKTEKIEIIPLCVEGSGRATFIEPHNRNIIFIGKLDYEPNNDALLYFIDNIYKHLVKQENQISFRIIGKNPSKELQKLTIAYDSIFLCGYVEDLQDETSKAFCSVAPMVSGSGMQTKILDAMEYGLPVMTTIIGYGDFNFKIGKEICVATNDHNYINQILELFKNNALANQIGKNGRDAVISTYGIEAMRDKYERIL